MENKILKRIQKLAAKAESLQELGNIEEASLFSAKVNELLTEHNLAMADIDTDEQDDVDGILFDDLGITRQFGKWTVSLLSVLCRYNYCSDVYTEKIKKFRYNRKGRRVPVKDKKLKVTIIGRPENVEVVTYLFSILKRQFETMASNEWKTYLKEIRKEVNQRFNTEKSSKEYKKPWKYFTGVSTRSRYMSSFFKGACRGVSDKLHKEMVSAEEKHGAKVTDLVVVNDAAIEEYKNKHFKHLDKMRSRSSKVNGQAYNKGKDAGRNASMAKGVSTGDSVATKHLNNLR